MEAHRTFRIDANVLTFYLYYWETFYHEFDQESFILPP